MAVRKRVLVSGRVQGVFFRASCRDEAERQGVAGYVRNLPDGRVEAVLEGEPGGVDAVVEWCRRGPSMAQVESLEVSEEEPQGDRGFRTL